MPKKAKKKSSKKEVAKAPAKKIKGTLSRESVTAEDSNESRLAYDQSRFGKLNEGKVTYSLCEGLYLLEKKRMDIVDTKKKKVSVDMFLKRANKFEPNFSIRYAAYSDMRSRGYIVKTALKFGADFRVYDRGVKPGEDHAKWIMYPLHEGEVMTLYEFSAKNRVAHSTRKQLLLAIVDDEGDVSYWEVRWTRP
jgi:tRNA-intron endonuclease, archaea type